MGKIRVGGADAPSGKLGMPLAFCIALGKLLDLWALDKKGIC